MTRNISCGAYGVIYYSYITILYMWCIITGYFWVNNLK